MTVHTESRVIRLPREALFDLVAQVESYPEFLPLWSEARVYWRRGRIYYTEQEVGLGFIRRRFRTKTVLARPHSIEVTSTDNLFRTFRILWQFDSARQGSRVSVTLDWEVWPFSLQRGIDFVLPETARMMVSAFEARAQAMRD